MWVKATVTQRPVWPGGSPSRWLTHLAVDRGLSLPPCSLSWDCLCVFMTRQLASPRVTHLRENASRKSKGLLWPGPQSLPPSHLLNSIYQKWVTKSSPTSRECGDICTTTPLRRLAPNPSKHLLGSLATGLFAFNVGPQWALDSRTVVPPGKQWWLLIALQPSNTFHFSAPVSTLICTLPSS
jgi:hypothetical protein